MTSRISSDMHEPAFYSPSFDWTGFQHGFPISRSQVSEERLRQVFVSWDNKCLSHKANTEAKQLKRKRRHKQFHLWMESVYICFIIWCFFFYSVLVCYLFGLFVISLIFSGLWMRVGGWWIDDSLLKVYAWQLISYQCHRGAIAGR